MYFGEQDGIVINCTFSGNEADFGKTRTLCHQRDSGREELHFLERRGRKGSFSRSCRRGHFDLSWWDSAARIIQSLPRILISMLLRTTEETDPVPCLPAGSSAIDKGTSAQAQSLNGRCPAAGKRVWYGLSGSKSHLTWRRREDAAHGRLIPGILLLILPMLLLVKK